MASKNPIDLVVILPENTYLRYHGKTRTHHCTSKTPLTAQEVEIYRSKPDLMMAPEEPERA